MFYFLGGFFVLAIVLYSLLQATNKSENAAMAIATIIPGLIWGLLGLASHHRLLKST